MNEMLNPPLPPDSTEELVRFYTEAVAQISAKLKTLDPTSLTARKQAALIREIDGILRKLGVDTSDWLNEHVPSMYAHGQATALVTLGEATTFAKAVDIVASLGVVNEEAVKAIVSDAHTDLLMATTKMSETAKRQVRDIMSDYNRLAKVTNEKSKSVARRAAVDMKQLGIAIVDNAGRRWAVDNYARVVVKSKLAQAHREGAMDRAVAEGYDLARISAHGAKDACRNFEGLLVSITGKTVGYPTVAQLKASSLIFHPNCKHLVQPCNPKLLPESVLQRAYEKVSEANEALKLAEQGKMNSHGLKKGA